ncbi:GGDEF domain-containing protein [Roseococcus sp. SYP-B2431]|uniref:GGDEF domain-containing protein n=1 Tax=Roseococcus sp. SYP-B2431 TaxID=2496640 RepID=UPI00103B823F|nr:GGDEF domain-containing protein [Roseococcus sp. SYP-B2431]TCH97058.1 GGDEF domain-containing protein [Roseococcus sp. SYP-B2431]
MDSRTAYVVLAMMTLANSGALGLILRDLPELLRPSVRSWQAGTLVIAGGYVLHAFPSLPLAVMVTLSNGAILLGLTICWRGVQQFDGLPRKSWQLLPAAAGTFAIFWYSALQPDTLVRILAVSLASIVILAGCVAILADPGRRDGSRSRQLLMILFLSIMLLNCLRFAYFAWAGIPADFSIADNGSMANVISPLVAAMLPVIGTTAFTLMCSERLRRQWEHAASTDHLTGLANRRTLTEMGRLRFETARTREERVAIALIDVDAFKSINDRFGHEAGDLALKHVAASLNAATMPSDLLARTGGEEFVALLGQSEAEPAQMAAERLRLAVQRHPFILRGMRIPLTVSVGIAVSQEGDTDFDSLLRRADQAMYTAKSAGRNRVELAA